MSGCYDLIIKYTISLLIRHVHVRDIKQNVSKKVLITINIYSTVIGKHTHTHTIHVIMYITCSIRLYEQQEIALPCSE